MPNFQHWLSTRIRANDGRAAGHQQLWEGLKEMWRAGDAKGEIFAYLYTHGDCRACALLKEVSVPERVLPNLEHSV
jgi:hypothetical protein